MAATTLYTDVTIAKALYSQKHDHFKSLSSIYLDRIPVWSKEDRQRRFLNEKKEIECVYRHNPVKGTHISSSLTGVKIDLQLQFHLKQQSINSS